MAELTIEDVPAEQSMHVPPAFENVPALHGVHMVLEVATENVPAAHGVHLPPAFENVFAGHAVHVPSAAEDVPAGQVFCMHWPPFTEVAPVGQERHMLAPAAEDVPAEQSMHVPPAKEDVPAEQSMHGPPATEDVPAEQSMHGLPATEYVPAEQAMHGLPATETVFAAHCLGGLIPSHEEPAGHIMQPCVLPYAPSGGSPLIAAAPGTFAAFQRACAHVTSLAGAFGKYPTEHSEHIAYTQLLITKFPSRLHRASCAVSVSSAVHEYHPWGVLY